MRRLARDPWLLLVVAAGAARVALACVLLFTGATDHNGWYFPNDDQTQYYSFAEALTRGELAPVYPTIGFDVLLAPFAAFTGFVLQAIPPVAVLQVLLGLAAGAVLYRVGLRTVGRRAAAVGAALWLAFPLLLGPFFQEPVFDFWRGTAPVWLGLHLGADYVSSLLAVALLALSLRAARTGVLADSALLGAVGGFALLVKPPNAVLLGAALLVLALAGRWRGIAAAAALAGIVFAPQLVLNHRYFGSVADFAYDPDVAERLPGNLTILTGGSFSAGNLSRVYRTVSDGLLGGPTLLALAALALAVVLWRRPDARWVLVPPVVGFGLLIGTYYYADRGHFARLIVPALPALALVVAGALLGGPAELPPATRGERPAILATAALAAAAAGLAVWIGVAPAAGPGTVVSATPVVSGLELRATVAGDDVRLSWRGQTAPADLVYEVLRLRDPDPAAATIRGFQWGGLEPVARVAAAGTTAVDRPGSGVWWYRVVVNPSPRAGGQPPYDVAVAVSPAVRVELRP